MRLRVLRAGLVVFSIVGGVQEASLPAGNGQPALEIYRFQAEALQKLSPVSTATGADLEFPGAERISVYLFVLRLEPDERFVSGRVEIRDGFFCTPRRRPRARELFAHVGYELLTAEAPAELRGTMALLHELLGSPSPPSRPSMKLKRGIRVRSRDVEHHDGYVAFVLPAIGGPTTRASMHRILTDRPGRRRGESRRRSRGAWVPDESEPKISKEDMVRILVRGGG